MIAFQCPKCQASLKAADDKAGLRSKCRECGEPVRVPALHTPGKQKDYIEDTDDSVVKAHTITDKDEEQDEPEEKRNAAEKIGAAILAAIRAVDVVFDFRFRRYLTPYLVRFFWGALLLLCVLELVGSIVTEGVTAVVGESLQERMLARQEGGWPEQGRFSQSPPVERRSTKAKARQAISEFIGWIVSLALRLCLVAMFLAVMRMLAEIALVLFDISNNLKEPKALYQRSERI